MLPPRALLLALCLLSALTSPTFDPLCGCKRQVILALHPAVFAPDEVSVRTAALKGLIAFFPTCACAARYCY